MSSDSSLETARMARYLDPKRKKDSWWSADQEDEEMDSPENTIG